LQANSEGKLKRTGNPKAKTQKIPFFGFSSFSWEYAPDGTGCIKNKILRLKKCVLKI
jgi:hypothetical protein